MRNLPTDIDQMRTSKYLRKEDLDSVRGNLVTIKDLDLQNVAQEGKPKEEKWTCYFREFDKPMVLGAVNRQSIAAALGTRNPNEWIGKQVVIFNDPNVMFGHEMLGGIRVRAVRRAAAPAAAPVAAEPIYTEANPPPADFDDDIPF